MPPKALDLNFLHSKDGRGKDRWFHCDYPTWHREWETQMASVLEFPIHPHPGPNREFLDWWHELPHRFLSLEGLLGDPRGGEVEEVVATRGTQVSPHHTQVPDVPNTRRANRRRRRVGTRMSQRDDGDGDGDERGDGLGVPDPMGGGGDDVFGGGYVPLGDDMLGDGTLSSHQLYPDFASPGTMERQLGREVCFFDLAAMWAQDDGEASGSH
ncbi:hypothetical protein PIB30_088148 [Stylosanthes scabra]|uniref:Aminotransferase-like plant mobile domain-containing protein n=1 Tax=Stylosanthes scabra TaxID=79078 RepID=A0ABU6XTF1_9FABA|nr:hypothetical protein [Stylosanthes scabra]